MFGDENIIELKVDDSKFRSSFHLKQKDIDYINEKGCGRPVDDPA